MSLLWFSKNVLSKNSVLFNFRSISTTPQLQIKEIKEIQKGKELTIYGEIFKSPREPYVLNNNHSSACPVCASGLDIKHTDVLILSQFVRSDGCMLPRRITGLCRKQQKRLMPNLNPSWSKKDPKRRYGWKKFNKYFDESTIKC
ncbi:hypothetical protein NQ318_001139 [Aromia moschata]|uniref:Uncharacterized protein n=1 Tax=Aromia moschata TaxID=1265417 RepID=A0AAV8ZEC1_9CUCU|nr:hypothetical protein NQ318_001139 [Aromia moschata]